MSFYDPICFDPSGGFHNQILDDGTLYDPDMKHVVGTCRFTVNFALCARLLGFGDKEREHYLELAKHGINFLTEHHWDPTSAGFNWVLKRQVSGDVVNFVVDDGEKWGYAVAFGLLACANAKLAGVEGMDEALERALSCVETFKDGSTGLFLDSFNSTMTVKSNYRGQNSNMHMCEALIAAFEATGERKHLNAAAGIAKKLTVELSAGCGWVNEHYDEDWVPDPEKVRGGASGGASEEASGGASGEARGRPSGGASGRASGRA
jgi:mannose/cellobiose epimerase-like protein (N-acyl-D-glucosamine 2-epimerase family)